MESHGYTLDTPLIAVATHSAEKKTGKRREIFAGVSCTGSRPFLFNIAEEYRVQWSIGGADKRLYRLPVGEGVSVILQIAPTRKRDIGGWGERSEIVLEALGTIYSSSPWAGCTVGVTEALCFLALRIMDQDRLCEMLARCSRDARETSHGHCRVAISPVSPM
ncbi:hypothetical protein WH47_12798 [Habropoda laboriosa]|uniref:Uncharacterized protein n=1 Tax=Habropoda laboriosa TaxID=597456 RepID=A0A0L7R5A0_9HYME|nr:hypothetical protein WH47_12798 [Habropoda laboriosa]